METTQHVDIEALVRTEIPPLPRAALRVSELTKDLTTSSRLIAEVIGTDPVLSANIIRAANSPLFARQRPINSLLAAVTALGNHAVHLQVVVLLAFDFYRRRSSHSAPRRAIWEHSLTTAFAAREICDAIGLRLGEQAFLCGLLHDIGRLLFFCYDGDRYAQLSDGATEQELIARETEKYGCDHAFVGQQVARHWRLSSEIANIIKYHHRPEESGEYALMAHVIDASDALSNSEGGTAADGGDLTSVKLIAELGLADEQLCEIWKTSLARMKEMQQFFS